MSLLVIEGKRNVTKTVLQIDQFYIEVKRNFKLTFRTVGLRRSEFPRLSRDPLITIEILEQMNFDTWYITMFFAVGVPNI